MSEQILCYLACGSQVKSQHRLKTGNCPELEKQPKIEKGRKRESLGSVSPRRRRHHWTTFCRLSPTAEWQTGQLRLQRRLSRKKARNSFATEKVFNIVTLWVKHVSRYCCIIQRMFITDCLGAILMYGLLKFDCWTDILPIAKCPTSDVVWNRICSNHSMNDIAFCSVNSSLASETLLIDV